MDSLYVHSYTHCPSLSAKLLVQEPDHCHRIQEDVGVKGQILKKKRNGQIVKFQG